MFFIGNKHFLNEDDYSHRHFEVDGKRTLPDELKDFLSNIVDPTKNHPRKADSLFEDNKYFEAIEEYTRFIDENSDSNIEFFRRGICYLMLNDFQEAFEDFSAFALLNPLNIQAHYYRAITCLLINSYSKIVQAKRDFSSIVQVDDSNGIAFFLRGYCYYLLLENEWAISDWSSAKNLGITETEDENWTDDYKNLMQD